jgi:hypothetical protein
MSYSSEVTGTPVDFGGAQAPDRTGDTRIFSPYVNALIRPRCRVAPEVEPIDRARSVRALEAERPAGSVLSAPGSTGNARSAQAGGGSVPPGPGRGAKGQLLQRSPQPEYASPTPAQVRR